MPTRFQHRALWRCGRSHHEFPQAEQLPDELTDLTLRSGRQPTEIRSSLRRARRRTRRRPRRHGTQGRVRTWLWQVAGARGGMAGVGCTARALREQWRGRGGRSRAQTERGPRRVVLGERSQAGLPESWRAPYCSGEDRLLEAPGTRLPRTPETRHGTGFGAACRPMVACVLILIAQQGLVYPSLTRGVG